MQEDLTLGSDRDSRLDRVFHALSNRTRRAMLAHLMDGPTMVTELAAPHAMSLPSVSKHLRVLEEAGLVGRSVSGRVHRCSIETAQLQALDEWLGHYRDFWGDNLAALADYVEVDDDGSGAG